MYIQITTRCNMQCPHCAFSCTEKGTDMSPKTFLTACKLAEQNDLSIFLGGGEPTIHSKFWEFVGIALGHSGNMEFGVGVVTNGKDKENALRLAKLSKSGIISANLSLDDFHEDIDIEVENAFKRSVSSRHSEYPEDRSNDLRAIRSVGRDYVITTGRAKVNGLGKVKHCICPELFVDPTGDVFSCGCKKKKIGKVSDFLKAGLPTWVLEEGCECRGI